MEMSARFAEDTKNHELTILHNDGLYRHLRFKRPGTTCMYFDIITVPGRLIYGGDMGYYVFSRIKDMLEFFRNSRPNPGYWSEKVDAMDRHSGSLKKFSLELFKEEVWNYVREYLDGEPMPDDLQEQLKEEVIGPAEEYNTALPGHIGMANFNYRFEDGTEFYFEMCDVGGASEEFDYRFLWCCHALPWAIKKFDEHQEYLCPNKTASAS